jgi:hypothetical protein
MRSIGLGVAAALFLAMFSPLGAAHAQMGGGGAPSGGAAASKTNAAALKDQRAKGMAAAPALVSAGGIDCQVADARFVGEGTDAKTKAKTSLYELACTGNEGLLVEKTGDTVQAFTCAQANEAGPDGKQSPTRCMLPGNADPFAGLAPYIAKSG